MRHLRKIVYCSLLLTLIASLITGQVALADEGHSHPEKKMEHENNVMDQSKMKMDHQKEKQEMHHHAPTKRKTTKFPPGTKEVVIDLSGPFCSKHPEEIQAALMELAGILHVEAFHSRNYILIRFNGDQVAPPKMETILDGLKGSGWRCDGTISTRKRTER